MNADNTDQNHHNFVRFRALSGSGFSVRRQTIHEITRNLTNKFYGLFLSASSAFIRGELIFFNRGHERRISFAKLIIINTSAARHQTIGKL